MAENPTVREKQESRLSGVGAAPGVARGQAFVLLPPTLDVPCYEVDEAALPAEVARFEAALIATRRQITQLRDKVAAELSEAEAEIFDMHLSALDDPALVGETLTMLKAGKFNVEHCLSKVTKRYLGYFASLDDSYMRERAADVRDVARRLLSNLLDASGANGGGGSASMTLPTPDAPRVIVASELTPSDTAAMSRGSVLALVTEMGNCTSHAVIMSRSLRIPAVVGLMGAGAAIHAGDEVLVDGDEGLVFVNPSEETLWRYGSVESKRQSFRQKVSAEAGLPDETLDGTPFRLCANINGPNEVPAMLANRAAGVGLFRTESLFLRDAARLPDEERQFQHYHGIVAAAGGLPVVIRTLDIGGDKPCAALFGANFRDPNPFMGLRAVRVCLERPEVFLAQLRATLRASAAGPIKILIPMIASVGEILQVRALLDEAAASLRRDGLPFAENIPLGAMIEIPSAALCVDLLAAHCDFFSIGTNDLVQYLLAVDRANGRIAHLYEPCNPAILRALRDIFLAANKAGIPCSVCGELAGERTFAPLLHALGAESLSMAPAIIPEIRYLLRHTTRADLDTLVNDAFSESDPRKIRKLLLAFANERMA